MTLIYEFTTALRGFHVYRCEWKPYLNQPIEFKRELDNPHDRFAVAAKTKLPGKLCAVIVGHVPREMSRHVWYAIREGAEFSGMLKSVAPRPSPLLQGGLEIIITMTAKWQNPKGMDVLKSYVEKVAYPENTEYCDDSSQILKDILDNDQSSKNEESESDEEIDG